MIQAAFIPRLAIELKVLIGLFLITLSIGFYTGIGFVDHTTDGTPNGIIENYKGNEDNEEAETMKFKKSKHEMYNILHTHFLSLSLIFLILGFLTFGTPIHHKFRKFLMIEPILSVLMTFGGIYLMWTGIEWMVYLVIFSGALMTLSYSLAVLLILFALFKKPKNLNFKSPQSGT